jgi:hypothetical protein
MNNHAPQAWKNERAKAQTPQKNLLFYSDWESILNSDIIGWKQQLVKDPKKRQMLPEQLQ